ncbi:MAG TPA: ATP-binding protein [Candidatus Paceibacterota bacterium]|nr:ATP-binding protein [Candidatus Paceibacterota bacterium]
MDTSLRKNEDAQSSERFFKRSIRFLYRIFFEPRSTTEDDRRRETILNVILVGSICLLLALDTLVLISQIEAGPGYEGIPFFVFSIFPALFIAGYIASRKGYFDLVSYFAITFFYAATTYGVYRWGTDLPSTLLMYALLIIMAGALIGTRFSLAFSAIVMISLIVCRFMGDAGAITIDTKWMQETHESVDVIKYCLFFFAIELIAWLSNKDIENSLARARRSERALIEKNESLESTVVERTRELRQAQAEKLAQLYHFAEFGRLSSGIFHDLMNPLSAVAANVNNLKDSLHPDMQDIRESVGRAVQASRKLERFVTTVRKQLTMPDHEEEFSVNGEIEEALALLSYKAAQTKVRIDWAADKRVSTFGNPTKLQHVIGNLISNAIDSYNNTALPFDQRIVAVRLIENKGDIKIIVRDHGCGISAAVIGKIFDPFFTTKERHRGMGIGLSNAQDIVVKDFKGTIAVKSVEREGSNFTIVFPRAHPPGGNGKQSSKINTEGLAPYRVLAEEGRRV